MSRKESQSATTWWNGMHMYWRENQVLVAFHTATPYNKAKKSFDFNKDLELGSLNTFLQMRGLQLSSFTPDQTARRDVGRELEKVEDRVEALEDELHKTSKDESALLAREMREAEGLAKAIEEIERKEHGGREHADSYYENGHLREPSDENSGEDRDYSQDLGSSIGKYLFPSHTGQGTTIIGCFNVAPTPAVAYYPVEEGYDREYGNESATRKAVRLINENLAKLKEDGKVPVLAAGPNWFGGGSNFGCTTTGGPGDPPVPLPAGDMCSGNAVNWSFSMPLLEQSTIAANTGRGVTVFVLDTMPGGSQAQVVATVNAAASEAGSSNVLLQTLATEMTAGARIKSHYQTLPDMTPQHANYMLGTGRDINGKPYGYNMVDHGVFVTGIVRSLAEDATIEYVRVLDDFGVGDTSSLVGTLSDIQARIQQRDLQGQKVVINLSLLTSPPDDVMPLIWPGSGSTFDAYTTELLNAPLHTVIASLTTSSPISKGAVVVAAAGNESFSAEFNGRLGPAYPAAYPEAIAVGAIDRAGNPALYSNNPLSPIQSHGIATYGGAVLPPDALTTTQHIDAVHGVYTASSYPALDSTNPSTPYSISEPNNHWAYWSGTSFATPIISALAARIVQNLDAATLPATTSWANTVQFKLTDPGGQAQLFGQSLPQTQYDSNPLRGVGVLQAVQECQSANTQPIAATPNQAASWVG